MRSRLMSLWDRFRSSFWFEPTLLSVFGLILAIGMASLDSRFDESFGRSPWISTSTSAATTMLSSLASTAFTLAGVSFSITMVTLSMASAQFGSRQLRSVINNSIADRVMGAFIATALYCMVVLRFVRDAAETETPFVPQLSTAVATLLGLSCLALLIWFVHEVSINIQAPTVIAQIATELDASIDRLFPEKDDDFSSDASAPPAEVLPDFDREVDLPSHVSGYIEGFDQPELISAGHQHDCVIVLKTRPGRFVANGQRLATARLRSSPDEDGQQTIAKAIQAAFVIGKWRSPRQDISCSIYDLVDIASRALSPGVNDPFTAMACVDRLGAGLKTIATRPSRQSRHRDKDGLVRLVTNPVTFPQLMDDAFRQIRQHGKRSVAVSIRLLESLSLIATSVNHHEDQQSVSKHASAVKTDFLATEPNPNDRNDFETRYAALAQLLNQE